MIGYEQVRAHALERPHAQALVTEERRFDWQQWEEVVAHAASGLSDLMSQRPPVSRPRAVFLAGNSWELAALLSACASTSLPVVGLDVSLTAESLGECLRQVVPSYIFADAALSENLAGALSFWEHETHEAPVLVGLHGEPVLEGVDTVPWDFVMEKWRTPEEWVKFTFEGLGFTSGTTGPPKLIVRSRSFDVRRAEQVQGLFAISADDVYLNAVPLSHASGSGWAKVFARAGASVVLCGDQRPETLAQAVAAEKPTATLLVPPVLAALNTYLEQAPVDTGSLRLVVTGGRHISPKLLSNTEANIGPVLHVYYGTSETGLNTLASPKELAELPTTAGAALEGNAVCAVGPSGELLPAGVTGRIAVSSYMLADGYQSHPTPQISAAGKRWWLTNDSGWVDERGRLFITGRDLPLGESALDLVGLEAHLSTIFDFVDVVAAREPAAVAAEGTGPLVTVAFTGSGPTPQQVATSSLAFLHKGGIPVLSVRACAVKKIPYSPTGKVRAEQLRSMLSSIPGVSADAAVARLS